MSDDLHAACDSRIMALESALHIANTDAASAVARLMGERDTARLQLDHIKAEIERLRAVVEAAKALLALHDDGRMVSALLDAKNYAELNAYGLRLHDGTEQLRKALAVDQQEAT